MTGSAAAPAGASSPRRPASPVSGVATADSDQPTQAAATHDDPAARTGSTPQLTEQEVGDPGTDCSPGLGQAAGMVHAPC